MQLDSGVASLAEMHDANDAVWSSSVVREEQPGGRLIRSHKVYQVEGSV